MNISTLKELGKVTVTVLRVSGPITDGAELVAHAQAAFDKGSRAMLIDLSQVPYMATAGLRALHTIYQLLRDASNENAGAVGAGIAAGTYTSPHLKLLNPNEHVLEALKTAGYDMFLQIHRHYQEALDSFAS